MLAEVPISYTDAVATEQKRPPLIPNSLITGLRSGDAAVWGTVVESTTPRLLAAAAMRGIPPEDREDIVQGSFLRFYTRVTADDELDTRNLSGYLMTTVQNACVDYQRSGKRQEIPASFLNQPDNDELSEHVLFENPKTHIFGPHVESNPETIVVQRDDTAHVRSALERLPDTDRRMIEMANDGYSQQEIRDTIAPSLSLEAIKSRMHRIRKHLKEHIELPSEQILAMLQKDSKAFLTDTQHAVFLQRQSGKTVAQVATERSITEDAVNKISRRARQKIEKQFLTPKKYVRLSTMAKIHGITRSISNKAIRAGKLQPFEMMGIYYVTPAMVDNFFRARVKEPKETFSIEFRGKNHTKLSSQTLAAMKSQLVGRQKEVFILHQQGLSIPEITQQLKLGIGSTKAYVKRAFRTIDTLFTKPNGYYRVARLAKEYGIHKNTARVASREGRIPTFTLMGIRYTTKEAVAAFKEKLQKRQEHVLFVAGNQQSIA